MIRTLLRKEVRDHALVVTVIGLAHLALGALLVVAHAEADDGAAPAVAWRMVTSWMLCLFAPALGARLVARELRDGTWRWLRTLPVRPAEVLAIKQVLGFGTLTTFALLHLLVAMEVAPSPGLSRVPSTGLAVRVLGFTAWIWAYAWVLSFLGRYRWLTVALTIFGLVTTSELQWWDVRETGPLALLIGPRSAPEAPIPWASIAGGALALMLAHPVGVALATWGRRPLAEVIAAPMTRGEMALVVAVVLVGRTLAETAEALATKPPYAVPDVEPVTVGGVTVTWSAPPSPDDPETLARRLDEAFSALGFHRPQVFVATRSDDEQTPFHATHSRPDVGIVLKVNPEAPGYDEDHLVAWVVGMALGGETNGRSWVENRLWASDGFGLAWTTRGTPPFSHSLLARQAVTALDGMPLEADTLLRLELVADRVGWKLTESVSWSVLETLRAEAGDAAQLDFLRARARPRPDGVRGWWGDGVAGWQADLVQTTGLTWPRLVAAWAARIESLREALPPPTRLVAEGAWVRVDAHASDLEVRVVAREGVPDDAWITYTWRTLGPLDARLWPSTRHRHVVQAGKAHEPLALGLAAGSTDRVGWTATWVDDELDVVRLSGWHRVGP